MGLFNFRRLFSYTRTDILMAVSIKIQVYANLAGEYLPTFKGSILPPSSDVSSQRRVH